MALRTCNVLFLLFFIISGLFFTGCGACATNKPLTSLPELSLPQKPAAIQLENMTVGVKVVFDGNIPAYYAVRRDKLRDKTVEYLNGFSRGGNINFVGLSSFEDDQDVDFCLRLDCQLDLYENRKNKIGFAICAPAAVSLAFTPIGITGLSCRGMVKEYSRFEWTASLLDGDNIPLRSAVTKDIEAIVSATGWGTPDSAMIEAFENTESHITAFVVEILNGSDFSGMWASLDKKQKQQQAQLAQATKPTAGENSTATPVLASAEKAAPVTVDKKYTSSNRYAVVVGISKYKYSGQGGLSDLSFADDDAKAFAASLEENGWSSSHIKLLTNHEATQRNLRIALESWLTKAGRDDLVVLFWSGHGFPDPADPTRVYFACYDTEANIPATGYRMDKVRAALEEVNCRNAVVFADTCHAGKIVTRGEGDEKAIGISPYVKKMEKEKDVPAGWIFMVASESDRKAIENTSWSHGAFTHCLLQALAGKADGFQAIDAQDGNITMKELRAYMSYQMPEITQEVLGVAKRPLIATDVADPNIWNLSISGK